LRAGTYAALFAVIGTTFGSADGTHFNVPDMRGVYPKGAGTTNRTLGKDANGNLAQMNVAKSINDLDKVKKGDVFLVEHAQAIAVGLTAAAKGSKPGVSGVRSVTIAGKGSAKPFEEVTDTIYATVKISTIDQKTRVVTFTLPSGEKQKVKVDPAVLGLEKFKAGDDVMVEFVDDTAIGFVTPKK
jgi:microcystin-dependent protein